MILKFRETKQIIFNNFSKYPKIGWILCSCEEIVWESVNIIRMVKIIACILNRFRRRYTLPCAKCVSFFFDMIDDNLGTF
jgi:hypothetical protein